MLGGIAIQELSTTVTEQLGLLLLKARLQLLRMEKVKFNTNSSKLDVPMYLLQTC